MTRFISFGTCAAGNCIGRAFEREVCHGKATRQQCDLETDRAAAAATEAPTSALSRTQAFGPAQDSYRHYLCPQVRHSLGGIAPGNGLRVWHDLLELSPSLAACRRLGASARTAVGRTPGGRRYRLVAGGGR